MCAKTIYCLELHFYFLGEGGATMLMKVMSQNPAKIFLVLANHHGRYKVFFGRLDGYKLFDTPLIKRDIYVPFSYICHILTNKI